MKKSLSFAVAFFLLLGVLFHPCQTFAAESEEWVKISGLPEARSGSASAVVDGKIYVFGGTSQGSNAAKGPKTNTTFEYNPISGSWIEKMNMPSARSGVTAAVYNNKVYVIGGYQDVNSGNLQTNAVEVYDPSSDTWTKAADLPTARSWASAVVLDNVIYVLGGTNKNGEVVSTVEAYDPLTNTWSKKRDMPSPLHAMAVVPYKGKIYTLGGWVYGSDPVNRVNVFDPKNESWTSLKDMPTARAGLNAVIFNNKIYTLGGFVKASVTSPSDVVEVLDIEENSWSTSKELTFPRMQSVAAVVNGEIYIIGGTNGQADGVLNTVEKYSIVTTPDPEQPEQPKGDRAILVVTMTTGIEKEFDLSMDEVNAFIAWYENKQAGNGTASYAIDKHNNNKGPFSSRKDYVIYDKILTFEVNEYTVK